MRTIIARCAFTVAALSIAMGAASAQSAAPSLTLLWPQSEVATLAYNRIKAAGVAEDLIVMMQERLSSPEPLTVVLGGGGSTPRIGKHGQLITVPYEHLHKIQAQLDANRATEPALEEQAMDAFVYSVVHQVAHVLVHQGETGQWLGEDAVADLTMLTLLEHMPDGGRIARHALEFFDKDPLGMVQPKDNYWAAHELNAERYWAGVCQLLGSGHTVQDVEILGHSGGESCRQHYAALKNSWQQVFAPELAPINRPAEVAQR